MSDLGLLWHEYERYNALAQQVTEDVIALKRKQFGLPGESKEESRARLLGFVDALREALENAQPGQLPTDHNQRTLTLPVELVEGIGSTHGGDLLRFLEELKDLRVTLSHGETPLQEEQLALLDELSGRVHGQTSRVFHRLRRR